MKTTFFPNRRLCTNRTLCRIVGAVLVVVLQSSFAQKPDDDVGNYVVTTIGNSLPLGNAGHPDHHARSHVMLACFGIEVSPDGRVYAGGHNESGHAVSVYQDGDLESDHIPRGPDTSGCWNWGTSNNGAVTFDDEYMYCGNGCNTIHKWKRTPPYDRITSVYCDVKIEEIVVKFYTMYVVSHTEGQVQLRNLDSDFSLIKSFSVPGAYDIAVESENSIWVSLGGKHGAKNEVRRYDSDGNQLSGTLGGFGKLMGISIGNAEGKLIVCDDGPDKQLFFYDISNPANPTLTREFGEKGGIYTGNRGVLDNDLQFFDVQDAGTDSEGNIYTLFSTSPLEKGWWHGCMVREYSPDGTKKWELSAEMGCDVACVLASSDGEEIYGVEEVFLRDYSVSRDSALAQQWKTHAMSKDDIANPADFRENRNDYKGFVGSARIRTVNGKRVMFRQGMYAESHSTGSKGYDFYVFEDRPSMVSHYRGSLTGSGWAWYPDNEGNIWEGNAKSQTIRMHEFSGFDASRQPKYESYTEYDRPAPFNKVERIHYDEINDVLYLSGYTAERPETKWGLVGSVVCRYDNWKAGNRIAKYETDVPMDDQDRYPKAMTVAGDYFFTVVCNEFKSFDQMVTIYHANTGEKVGTMCGEDIYGNIGWVDIVTGITAYQRSNGEYLVIVEENAFSKNLVYRWCPDGDCRETTDSRSLSIKARAHTQADVCLQIAGERLILDFICETTNGIVHITDCCGRTVLRKTLRNADRMVVPIDDKARGLYFAKVFTGVTSTVHRFLLR